MTKEEAFEIIKTARQIVNQIDSRRQNLPTFTDKPPSEKTIAGYYAEYKRLTSGTKSLGEVLYKARLTSSVRTWHRRRAALIYIYLSGLKKLLAQQDKLQKNPNDHVVWLSKVKGIKGVKDFLIEIENEPAIKKSTRKPATSKKKDLYGLPIDWREQVIARMPTYECQMLTLALTGCRPCELVKGIEWSIQDGKLTAQIEGAKISKYAGQKTRILSFAVQDEMTKRLASIISENGGNCTIKLFSAVNLTTAIRAAAQRAFPKFKKSVTAYSFRHQAAADWKSTANTKQNSEQSLILVSAMLGHATSQTKGRYGHSSQARGKLMPEKVEASQPIKVIQKKSYIKHTNNKPIII